MTQKSNIFISFFRFNIVSIVASTVDFVVFILLNNLFLFWYVFSAIIGAVSGGITAFILNRNWVFKEHTNQLKKQIISYTLVWIGSVVLNTGGLYLLVENSNLSEVFAKVIITGFVGISYNYTMSKYFIFK